MEKEDCSTALPRQRSAWINALRSAGIPALSCPKWKHIVILPVYEVPKIKLSIFGSWKVYAKEQYIVYGTLEEFIEWYKKLSFDSYCEIEDRKVGLNE